MSWFYYIGRAIVRLLILLLTRWQVTGGENVPREGPLLIVANHLHLADPPLLGISIRRKVMFMAKEELFRQPFVSYFMRRFGTFPVHRGRFDRQALRQALQLLAKGMALMVFPEGKRSRSGQLQPASHGAALIAAHSGVPILPVGISGTDKIKGLTWWLHRPKITVNIGPPFYLASPGSKVTREELADFTDNIMRHIAAVLPPEYRGAYQA